MDCVAAWMNLLIVNQSSTPPLCISTSDLSDVFRCTGALTYNVTNVNRFPPACVWNAVVYNQNLERGVFYWKQLFQQKGSAAVVFQKFPNSNVVRIVQPHHMSNLPSRIITSFCQLHTVPWCQQITREITSPQVSSQLHLLRVVLTHKLN